MVVKSIKTMDLEPQHVLYMRREVAQAAFKQQIEICLPQLFGHAIAQGLPIAGQPMTRYVSLDAQEWIVDFALPMASAVESDGEMLGGVFAGGPAVVCEYLGPYDQLDQAGNAMKKWSVENGLMLGDEFWEQYVTDPEQETDPSLWQTDLYWPLA